MSQLAAMNQFVAHDGIYMLSHSVGLPLVGGEQAAASAFWQPWQRGDADIWNHWLAEIAAFRATVCGAVKYTDGQYLSPDQPLQRSIKDCLFIASRS